MVRNDFDMISVLNLLRLVLWPRLILENVPCVLRSIRIPLPLDEMFCITWNSHIPQSTKTSQCPKGFPGGTSGTELACQYRKHKRGEFDPWVGATPWRSVWECAPISLLGESQGQRSLPGYSPLGHKRVRHNWSNLAHMYLLSGNCYVLVIDIHIYFWTSYLFFSGDGSLETKWGSVGLLG